MPGLFDSKNFNAEVFGKYYDTIPKLKRNELVKSKAIVINDRIKPTMAEQTGGNIVTVPLFGRIGGTVSNYDGQTDIVENDTPTFTHTRVVVGRANAWVEKHFAYDITGGVDFMDNVAKQVSEYWDEIDQDTILSILKGIFGMTGAENKKFVDGHTSDITKVDSGKFNEVTLNNALQAAVGENKVNFSLAIMHSQVATNLENLNLLEHLKYTDATGVQRDLTLATLNGRAVIIDDSMPTEVETTSSGNVVKYTTYILGEGAFEFTDAGVKVPFEMDRNPKVNGGQDTLYSRQRHCFAPYGINFTNKSMKTLSPTNQELENGTNWELVNTNASSGKQYIDHKAVPIARVISLG